MIAKKLVCHEGLSNLFQQYYFREICVEKDTDGM